MATSPGAFYIQISFLRLMEPHMTTADRVAFVEICDRYSQGSLSAEDIETLQRLVAKFEEKPNASQIPKT